MDLEKFEMNQSSKIEPFNNFTNKAKDAISSLIEQIKNSIKAYKETIDKTNNEINDNKTAKEKCEQEIVNIKAKITNIKSNIDNVQSTYKRMVDAYSSTSKGETKDIYSEIITGAKANCEKDVEKNKNEIIKLNGDIEAIKNNINEFTKSIDSLSVDLARYKEELEKYTKAREYMENISDKMIFDLDNILSYKDVYNTIDKITDDKDFDLDTNEVEDVALNFDEPVVDDKDAPKIDDDIISDNFNEVIKDNDSEISSEGVVADEPVKETKPNETKIDVSESFDLPEPEETLNIKENKPEVPKVEAKVEPKVAPIHEPKPAPKQNTIDFDDSLKQIYDLTGYTPPKKEEPKKEEKKQDEIKIDLRTTPKSSSPKATDSPDLSDNFSEWEKILNGGDEISTNKQPAKEEKKKPATVRPDELKTLNELLKPYGTTYEELKGLTNREIEYKDGSKKEFKMEVKDVIAAVNNIDGNDLKNMKRVGPQITLLKKVKSMKEGK